MAIFERFGGGTTAVSGAGGAAISSDTTYYVDGDNGDDTANGLAWATAKKTMDFLDGDLPNALPREINADVTVYVSGSVLSTGIVYHTRAENFYGVGSLTIEGVTTDVETGIAVTGQDNVTSSLFYHRYLEALKQYILSLKEEK